jgi:DNA-binding CsgD family transcriptional regulator
MSSIDEPHAFLVVLHDDILLVPHSGDEQPDAIEKIIASDDNQEPPIPPTQQKPEYLLTEQDCVIGRNPECTIRLKNHRIDISRRHATIKREGLLFVLYDHSSNGTFVNHHKIDQGCPLHSNDVLGFADSMEMLRFIDRAHPKLAVLLTKREHDVLCLLADGQSNKQIAAALHIDPETVKNHTTHIYDKLGVRGRVRAVMRARMLGLLASGAAR